MSGLPSTTDVTRTLREVRVVPEADIPVPFQYLQLGVAFSRAATWRRTYSVASGDEEYTRGSHRKRNVYVCPAGKLLTTSGIIDQGRILPYRASAYDCSRCELKPRCTTAIARKVSRDIDEDIREHVRALANTEAFQQSRRERKKIEMSFAKMKRILKLERLRLRGMSVDQDEVVL